MIFSSLTLDHEAFSKILDPLSESIRALALEQTWLFRRTTYPALCTPPKPNFVMVIMTIYDSWKKPVLKEKIQTSVLST